MTEVQTAARAAAVLPRTVPRDVVDASGPLLWYCLLLFVIPAKLTIHELGAAGSPASLYGIGLFFWWLLLIVSGRLRLRGFGPAYAFLAFAMVCVASYVFAASRGASTAELSSADRGLMSLMSWAGVALVAMSGLRTERAIIKVVRYIAAGGAFVAVIGLIQYTTGFDPTAHVSIPGLSENQTIGTLEIRSGLTRVTGTASHPIEFGVVLSMALACAGALALRSSLGKQRRYWAVAAVLIGIADPLGVARSGIIALVVVAVTVIPTWPKQWRRRAYLAAVPGAILMRLGFPGLIGTIRGLFVYAGNDPSSRGRTDDYPVVWAYFLHRPILGQGFATFLPTIYRTLDNQILGTLVETGLIGVAAFLLIFIAGIRSARRGRRDSHREGDRLLGQFLAGAIAAAAVSSLTFDSLGFPMFAGLTFLLIGLAGALEANHSAPGPVAARSATSAQAAHRSGDSDGADALGRRVAVAVALPVLAAVLAVGYLVHNAAPVYVSDGSGIVSFASTRQANIYTDQTDTSSLSALVYRTMSGTAEADRLKANGHLAAAVIAQGDGSLISGTDRLGGGPILRVESRSADPVQARDTTNAMLDDVSQTLTRMQDAYGVADSARVRFTGIVQAGTPYRVPPSTKRELGGLLLLAYLSWELLRRRIHRWLRVRLRSTSAGAG